MLNPAYGDTAGTLAFDSYSTAARDTGRKWIDGKAIWRKVITASGNIATGYTNYAHNITSEDRIISLHGICLRDDAANQQILLTTASISETIGINTFFDETYITIEVGSAWTGAGSTLSDPIFVLEYTKS